jgi:hypothetical protein
MLGVILLSVIMLGVILLKCRGGISDNLSNLALLFLLQQVKGDI